MGKTLFFAVLLSCLIQVELAATPPATNHKMLDQPSVIQGYPCDKGFAWFFLDGRLQRCTLARAMSFGEARVPAGSMITLLPDGRPNFVQLSHSAPVAGYLCMGAGWMGVAEGSTTAFYPSGKLKQCYLAGDQMVQGVPCMNGSLVGDGRGGGAQFYESGKLRSCRLTRDFGAMHRGDRFVQGQ